ncbi:MAG: hypothetical protein Q8R92_14825 [Deltaproteobacteria bacterium]|nr:hypothetical protein [Deltaproteobacteria bacterium]
MATNFFMAARGRLFILGVFLLVLAWPSISAAQDLFVVSQATQEVKRYDGTTGAFVSTFISPVTSGFQLPGGMAIRPSDGVLWVSSTATSEFWKYTTATGAVITPVAKTGLLTPGALTFDGTGANIYFLASDTVLSVSTDAVKKMVVSSGSVSTLATDGTANFNFIALNGSDLYVSDAFNNLVKRVPDSGGSGTNVISSGLSSPAGILFRSSTDMLVADMDTDRVLEYTFNGSSWVFDRVVLASGAGVDGPMGIALAPDGKLTVAGQFTNNVVAVDLTTLAVTTLVSPGAGGLSTPSSVAWNGSTLLVSSLSTNAIIYYDSAGTPTGTLARGISTPADSGMTFTAAGNIIVGSQPDNDVVEYSGQIGTEVRKFFDACPTSFAFPFDQVIGTDGNLYISCPASDGIYRFNGVTGDPMGPFVTGLQGLVNPQGLSFGPNGNLFVAGGFPDFNIKEFNGTTGAFVGVFVDSLGNTGMDPIAPWAITFHTGNLFVSSWVYDDVKEFNGTTGAFVQTFVTAGSGGLDGPTGIEFGPDGDLYVVSKENDSIKRYDGANGAFIDTFVSSGSGGLDAPVDLAFPPAQSGGGGGVPALSPEGFALFLLLSFSLGAWRLRRARLGAAGCSRGL